MQMKRWILAGAMVAAVGVGALAGGRDQSADAAGGNSITSPDPAGLTGLYASMELDASGFPVISYLTDSGGLKVMHCNDPNCAGGDESVTAPPTQNDSSAGGNYSLKLDASGYPVVAYDFKSAAPGHGDIGLMHCNDVNCAGGDESVMTLDSAGQYSFSGSLVLDAPGFPVLSYYYGDDDDLKVMHCNDINCAGGDESVITSPDSLGAVVGEHSSLRLDASGFPVVSYNNTFGGLKLMHCNDPNCAGGGESITSPDTGTYAGRDPALMLDASGLPVVAYFGDSPTALKLMHCNDVNCSGGDESIRSVVTIGGGGLRNNSLALDAAGFPVISYFGSGALDLNIVHCNDANCAGGNEVVSSPDTAGNVGRHTSLLLDSSGFPVVSYYDHTNQDVKVLHCGAPDCMTKSMKSAFKIAFTTTRDGDNEIFVMNADGAGQVRLTENDVSDLQPSWSPDGTKIAFRTNRDGNDNIYVMNADGSAQTQLTNEPSVDADPVWSPDGSKIAFASNRTGTFEIYVMNADGSAETNISNAAGNDVQPGWSPDGTKFVFTTDRNGGVVGSGDVYTMNIDGTGATNLTDLVAQGSGAPVWSPDGTRIAFHNFDFGYYAIWTMNANGTNRDQMTFSNDTWPTWKAGGEKIAFTSSRDGNAEIYTMDPNGMNETNITNASSYEDYADWRRVSGPGLDFDSDGCTDAKEAHSNQTLGGRRNPQNFWDFFDTPSASNVRDKAIAGTDFFNLLARFGSSGSPAIDPLSAPPPAPAYHTAYDRGPAPAGQDGWDLTAANGAIAGTDFFAVLGQFGHTCA